MSAPRLDSWSSASRQHYIDTGRYLREDGTDPGRGFEDLSARVAQLAARAPERLLVGTLDTLLCPYCGEDASPIRVVDTAVRWTDMESPDFARRVIPVAYDGHGEFELDRYECGSCDREVQLPEGWSETILH